MISKQESSIHVLVVEDSFSMFFNFLSVIVCLFDLGLTSLSTFFSHIATVSGCGRELNAHF